MLKIDFEQAFVLHNDYKDSEKDLFKLSLKILAFPILIIGALASAGLMSSVDGLREILDWPPLWLSLVVAGVLNAIVVRAYVVTDRVQTEAKYQVNALRSLYLSAVRDDLPEGWQPVWGSTNPYLATKAKLKAATLTPLILGLANAAYVGYGLDRTLYALNMGATGRTLSIVASALFFVIQLEMTWNVIRRWLKQ